MRIEKCTNEKKSVVLFTGGLNFGGMERVIFIMHNLLKEIYDVKIVTLYQTNADYDNSIVAYNFNIPPSTKKYTTFLKRLYMTAKMKNEIKPDIVFSFGMYLNYLNVLSNYLVKHKSTTIMGIRSYDWLTQPFFYKILDKWIVNRFDKINSVSKKIALDAEKIWAIPCSKNKVLYNPYKIDVLERFASEEVDDFVFLNNCFYFITVCRLSDQKGLAHLIRAFSMVFKACEDARLIIIGNGTRFNDLSNMIYTYGLEEIVLLLGGRINPHKYVKRSNAYVLSSISEGFPNALAEAMCIGTPVIAVDCNSGPREMLSSLPIDSFTIVDYIVTDFGILTAPLIMEKEYTMKDISIEEKALAEAMIYAYKHPRKMIDLAAKAKKHMEIYNYALFQRNVIEILED